MVTIGKLVAHRLHSQNTYLKNITASYQGHSYTLDVADMYNAWGNRSLEHPGVIRYFGGRCYDKSNCQFRGIFSDAAGSFVAEWLIVDGLAIRTVLTSSNDVVNLFKKIPSFAVTPSFDGIEPCPLNPFIAILI